MRTAPQNVAQFTGSYLGRLWARRFIVGTLLPRYDPARVITSDEGHALATSSATTAALLRRTRWLRETWATPARPLDTVSEKRIFRLLARYAAGEGLLSDEALEDLKLAFADVPGAPTALARPEAMLRLLQAVGYVAAGDNIHRVAYQGSLHYPPQAHALMTPYLSDQLARDGGDPFDSVRVRRAGPGYAIDSISTSEVDDAIGVEYDATTGEPTFTVFVSDATVYCPFDSPLEQVTARALTTTTYLPEGVFFMLPKPIVEAATLRDDRPCRTFNVRFKIDAVSGDVTDYTVEVGWLQQLRRVTYDQVQALLVPRPAPSEETSALLPHEQPPAWLSHEDIRKLATIYDAARLRLAARQRRRRDCAARAAKDPAGAGDAAENMNLPDPLVKVKGTTVLSVEDQVVCTQDARLAVAELMIAANEVCSRVAQANGIAIPHRGTRPRSSEHEVARYETVPQGVCVLPSLDRSHTFVAEAIHNTVRRLSSVTRAVYHHTPLYHAGLETSDYTHSTSPLRRYADMLVHHQLKVWLREQSGGPHSRGASRGRKQTSSSSLGITPGTVLSMDSHQLIPEFTMAALCAKISTQQEQASLLQDSSTRFWILKYLQDGLHAAMPSTTSCEAGAAPFELIALVGSTRDVHASPEYARYLSDAATRADVLASSSGVHSLRPTPRYSSDIYIPSLQLAHTLAHDDPRVVVGAVVSCCVSRVMPEQGVLELRVQDVVTRQDERQLERLWSGAVVASLDA